MLRSALGTNDVMVKQQLNYAIVMFVVIICHFYLLSFILLFIFTFSTVLWLFIHIWSVFKFYFILKL